MQAGTAGLVPGFIFSPGDLNATFNPRVESRRGRIYETPRVVGWEGLTEVAICRPQSKNRSGKNIF